MILKWVNLFVLSLCLPVAVMAQERDKVYLHKGVTATGKVETISRDTVVINVKGKPQTYNTNEISKVVFDDEPPGLENARNFIANRQFNLAEAELKKIGQVKEDRVAKELQFYRGYVAAKMALSGMGDARAAAGELAAAHKANPDSHHAYKAAETLGDLAMALSLAEPAARYYSELSAAPYPELKALAAYKLGDAALSSGKLPEARRLFEQLLKANATDAEMNRLKNLAEVGLAVCEAREGKSQEALAKLQKLVKDNDSTDQALFARIFNAMGICYQALGDDRQAALAYLRTDLLFSNSPELHAEALYQLSQIFPKIGDPQNANKARQRLVAKYPASSWANKK